MVRLWYLIYPRLDCSTFPTHFYQKIRSTHASTISKNFSRLSCDYQLRCSCWQSWKGRWWKLLRKHPTRKVRKRRSWPLWSLMYNDLVHTYDDSLFYDYEWLYSITVRDSSFFSFFDTYLDKKDSRKDWKSFFKKGKQAILLM